MFKKKIIKILAILILASTSVMFTSCEEKDTNNISSEATTTTTEATTRITSYNVCYTKLLRLLIWINLSIMDFTLYLL